MAETNGTTAPANSEAITAFAVVQAGYVSPSSEIVSFTDDDGAKLSQLIAVFTTKERADSYKNRLSSLATKILTINGKEVKSSTALYATVQVTMKGKRKGRVWTEAEKKAAAERLKKARAAQGKK